MPLDARWMPFRTAAALRYAALYPGMMSRREAATPTPCVCEEGSRKEVTRAKLCDIESSTESNGVDFAL